MEKKVLITGGAGYLGSVLTGYLLNKGYQVTCLDSLIYGQKSLFIYSDNPNFNFVFGDVRDRKVLEKIVLGFDAIIPLAALVGMPVCDRKQIDAISTNRDAIILLNELRSNNQRIIYPTTNSGYGTKSGDIFCTEKTPLEPVSLYGTTKVEAEKHLLESGKDAITLRLATVFGISPRMRTDLLVNDFVLKAVSDSYIVIYQKDFKRNYVHIKDVARCFEHCIEKFDSMKNQAYNVGLDNANLSKSELAEKVKQYIPRFEIVYKEVGEDPDKRNYVISNEKLKKTGFSCIYSLDDGIKELIKGYNILLRQDPHKNV